MNKNLPLFFALVSLLMSTSIVNAQYCYNTLSLNYDATVMEQIGDFIYKGTDDGGRRTGSTNRILIVDIDNVTNKNLQICGKQQPAINYEKKCVMVKDFDRKFTVAQVREFDGINRPCTSRDLVFIDIIDTKFSLTRLANCGGLSLKNVSIPFQPIQQSGNITPPAVQDTIVGYDNFPEKLESNFPISINYYKPIENYLAYEFVVTNLTTNIVTVYPSSIGESITLPDENLLVELKIKGINDKLNHKVRFYKTELRRTFNISACNSYKFYDLNCTETGTYTYTKTNVGKCDSAITLNLTILESSTNTINKATCDASFTLNGQNYTNSGTFKQTLKNYKGCDSVITLNLTLNKPSSATINKATCDASFTLNGQNYTNSGTFKQTLKNYKGCDSLITLNLTLNKPSSATINKVICENSFTYNNKTYTTDGTFKVTLSNKAGCDSVVTLALSFIKINAATTLGTNNITSQEANAEYIWYNCDDINLKLPANNAQIFTPSKSGKYAVKLTKSGCNANSACVNFTIPLSTYAIDEAASFLSLAPNPTNGLITLNLGKIENEFNIQVINNLGNTIASAQIHNSNSGNMNIQDQPAGVYFIIVHNNNGISKAYKIVKN